MNARRIQLVMLSMLLFTCMVFAQPTKIACVGNSITEGAGIADQVNDAWPGQLQKLLGDEYTVLNAGHSGRTMLKKGDYPLWVEPAFKNAIEMVPDIVFILLGTNDTKPYNWIYKDEFVSDYISMIDTFRVVNPDVQIYACLPPPAFSVQWDIRDSVITTDQIPMIRHIADSVNVDTVDFYQPFIDRNELFPDDIHPNAEGSWEMAKVAYKTMTGNDVSETRDVNLARDKSVTIYSTGESFTPTALVDGDWRTRWSCHGAGAAVVDLGAVESIDLFVTDFGAEGRDAGQYYKISVSVDSTNWSVTVDYSEGGEANLRMAVDRIQPTNARYVKLEPIGPVTGTSETVGAYEFGVYRTATVHAPVFYIDDIEPSSRYTRFTYYVVPTTTEGYLKVVRSDDWPDPFTDVKGYRISEAQSAKSTVRPDRTLRYFTKAYYNGLEVLSADTLTIDWSISAVQQGMAPAVPGEFHLYQNYPNPFNPSTHISYSLSTSADVELAIFNVAGKKVRTLERQHRAPGLYSVMWDGLNKDGQFVSSGLYYYRLQVDGNIVQSKKMVLLR